MEQNRAMSRLSLTLLLSLGVAGFPPAHASEPASASTLASSGLTGRVLGEVAPIAAVRVWAFQLRDSSLLRAVTDEGGRFRFEALPAGLYKIIAHKAGFAPAVVMLRRGHVDSPQFLELQLAEAAAGEKPEVQDFWTVRDEIPPDILREIQGPGETLRVALSALPTITDRPFQAQMEAMTGFDQTATAEGARVSGGQLGVAGKIGGVRLGIEGDYWQLAPANTFDGPSRFVDGEARTLAVQLETAERARFDLRSSNNRLVAAGDSPVDFDRYEASWVQPLGEGSEAQLSADFTSQRNFYRRGVINFAAAPGSSETWAVEGSYRHDVGERSSFETGFRYRDQIVGVGPGEIAFDPRGNVTDRLDLFGRAGHRVQPRILVEYGFFSTLRDGSVSLAPQGGLVVQISDSWQASTLFSHRLTPSPENGSENDFVTALHGGNGTCNQGEHSCYSVLLTKSLNGLEAFSVGAVQRTVGDTQQVFFDQTGFLGSQDSLYLVEGDRVPELQVALQHHLAPQIVAKLEGNVGSGGGGILHGDHNLPFENSVRYLVTSLDTRFEGSQTGVFLSFYRLEQELTPIGSVVLARPDATALRGDLERLQMMLTQDLDSILNLASNWAIKLDMEVSRGSALSSSSSLATDELRKKILGGLAIRF